MKQTITLLILVWILLAHPLAVLAAQTCQSGSTPASTPTARFADNGDGTVTDTVTGLMWKRCSEGQSWDGATCAGPAGGMTWQGALQAAENAIFAGHTDWRLPNLKELSSIVERQCVKPAINLEVFPGTPSSPFWSGSPSAGVSDVAWLVSFSLGIDLYGRKGIFTDGVVRVVRGGL